MSTVALGANTRPVGIRLVAAAEVPPGDVWLGPRERARLAQFRFPNRRADWRLGRWAAKRAAAAWLDRPAHLMALSELEVLADDRGVPRLHVGGAAPLALSLSHRAGWAIAVVAPPDVALGCDLEPVELRSAAFVMDYFTAREQAFVAARGPLALARRTTLVWCAKECALKALHEGLRLDTRSVELVVRQGARDDGWLRVAARAVPEGPTFEGWWRRHGALLACVLGRPALEIPSLLP